MPQAAWSIPGTISAAVVRSPIGTASSANPLGSAATSAPTALASNALIPLTYWYGHPDTKSNPQLLDRLIRNLGVNVLERQDLDPQGTYSLPCLPWAHSGMYSTRIRLDRRHPLFICFRSELWIQRRQSSHPHQDMCRCISKYVHIHVPSSSSHDPVNVILVVGHEKLNAEMQRLYGSQLTVVKIPKSGGVFRFSLLPRVLIPLS